MKIVFLSNKSDSLYNARKELITELINKGFEVVAITPRNGYCNELEELGLRIIEIEVDRRGKNPLKDIRLYRMYIKLLKREKPAIVFSYTIKPNVFGGMACSRLGIPFVANITGLGSAVENPGMLQKITLILYRIGLKDARKVFFQNNANLDFMLDNKIVKENYSLLPGSGVNLEKFVYIPYPPKGEHNFCFISRIMKEKGIDQYLETARYIKSKYKNTNFYICGSMEDEYREIIEKNCKEKIIIYLGFVTNMPDIYKQMTCIIHPSYYPEGMSNVLLEGSASGRPIITTDRSGCREAVEEGINGYIVKQRDTQDLIKKVELFLSQPYEVQKNMGINGRRKMEREFDRKIVIERYLDEVRKVSK